MDLVILEDSVNGSPYGNDLSNQAAWDKILIDVANHKYTFIFIGTPCNSFSRLRHRHGGPPPLRTHERPLGKAKWELSHSDWKTLQLGNYFALQTATLALMCIKHGVGFGIENPEP